MNSQHQFLIIQCLLSNADVYAICRSILKPAYFNPEYRKHVEFIHTYYDKYHAIPPVDIVNTISDVTFTTKQITRDEHNYYLDTIEQFCRTKAIAHAVLEAGPIIKAEDESKYGNIEKAIRDAVALSINKDMGISYFDNILERLEKASKEQPRISTGWPEVDDNLDGGLARTEFILFTANSGGGKSITLANLGINMLQQKKHVLYISLELSEALVSKRYDLMFTGIPTAIHREKFKTIAETLQNIKEGMASLVIKYMPSGTNSNQIRAYLKEYELLYNRVPDLLIVDYLDLMSPNEKMDFSNVFEKDKLSSEQLRNIGSDYDMIIASASQQNRSAIEAPNLNQGHIAGGLSKINTVDVVISLILTPTMKAQGEIGMHFLKTRSSDGVGNTVYCAWHNNSLRITGRDQNSKPLISTLQQKPDRALSVLDLIDT